ncbi:hypothetical protein YC2023_084116 [Brassica napus]
MGFSWMRSFSGWICRWWFLKSVEASRSGRRARIIGPVFAGLRACGLGLVIFPFLSGQLSAVKARGSASEVDLPDLAIWCFIVDGSVLSALVFSGSSVVFSGDYAAFEIVSVVSCGSLTSGTLNRLEVKATSFGSRRSVRRLSPGSAFLLDYKDVTIKAPVESC